MEIKIDMPQVHGWADAVAEAPDLLAKHLVAAFQQAGKQLQEAVRADLSRGLKIRAKGLVKTFKAKAADASRVQGNINKIFVDVYTKWKGAGPFETGGTIAARRARSLTVLTDLARGAGGRRRWTQAELKAKIASGEFRIIRTPRGAMIVQDKSMKLTKKGKYRKGARINVIAFLKRAVREPKRLDFYGVFNRNVSLLTDLAEVAVENTFLELAQQRGMVNG